MAGTPIPQGSKKAFVRGGRVSLVEANPGLKGWRSAVALGCKQAMLAAEVAPAQGGPMVVELVFVFERPKSVTRDWMSVKPDVDKLCRAVLDGVSDSGFWVGDQQVVELRALKRYGVDGEPAGVWVDLRHAKI